MKQLYFLFAAVMVSMTLQAAPISKQQARQKAQTFMATHGMQIVNEPKRAPGMPSTEEQPFYIFNAKDKKGFVIISADDCTESVLGYSANGSYDENDVPDNLRNWMEGISKSISALSKQSVSATTPRFAPKHDAIAPLIKTEWDQGDAVETGFVYNLNCPTIDKIYTVTGCVATATAQIMYYYQWPKKATTSIPEYYSNDVVGTLKALPSTTFKWDEMQLSYTGDEPQTQQEAVAELMRYCGQNAEMNYGTGGSSASIVTAAQNMTKYFDFDPYTYQWVRRCNYSISEWDALIYKELAEGRPVLYSGNSSTGGHAFLCDGYDGEGLYHINWGWGSYYNGFFLLHIANPYEGDVEEDGYSIDQDAIIGLQPNTGVVPEEKPDAPQPDYGIVANTFGYELDGAQVKLCYQNRNDETYKFAIGIGLLKDDNTIEPLVTHDEYAEWDLEPYYYYTLSLDLNEANLPQGQHKLVAISRESDSSEWKRCVPYTTWLAVTVNADGSITDIVQHPVSSLSINNVKVLNCTNNELVTFTFDVTNLGDDYNDYIYVFLDKAGESGDYYTPVDLNLKEGESITFRVESKTMNGKGNYTVRFTTDWEGEEIISTIPLEIGGKLKAEKWEVTTNQVQYLKQNIKLTVNNSGNEYNGSIYIFASKTSAMRDPIYRVATALEKDGSETFDIPCIFAESGIYTIWACNDKEGTDFIGTTTMSIKAAPTTPAALEATDVAVNVGKNTTLSFTLKNTGDVAFYDQITVHLFKQEEGKGSYPWEATQRSVQLTLEPGDQLPLMFTFEDMEEGKNYCLAAYYPTNLGKSDLTELVTKWFSTPVADDIKVPTANMEDETTAYYTLSGIRMNSKPSKSGIYIKNGKKVLIK